MEDPGRVESLPLIALLWEYSEGSTNCLEYPRCMGTWLCFALYALYLGAFCAFSIGVSSISISLHFSMAGRALERKLSLGLNISFSLVKLLLTFKGLSGKIFTF